MLLICRDHNGNTLGKMELYVDPEALLPCDIRNYGGGLEVTQKVVVVTLNLFGDEHTLPVSL